MIRFYMDENVHGAITQALRRRGVDVLTAQEDVPPGTPDDEVLDRATELGRVLVSQDDDLLREASARQRRGEHFSGVIFARQNFVSIGQCVLDLELISVASEPEEFANHARYLPLL